MEIVHRRNFSEQFPLLYYYTRENAFAEGVARTVFFLHLICFSSFDRNNARYIVVMEQKREDRKNQSTVVSCIFVENILRDATRKKREEIARRECH